VNLESILLKILESEKTDDASHGLDHIKRVWTNVKKIVSLVESGESVDLDVLKAATYLHDLVNPPKNHPDRSKASIFSADKAVKSLEGYDGFSQNQLDNIRHSIASHSFSAGINPETIEAKILQDADRLEALGVIGIARCFYTAGRLGSNLFHQDDPFAKDRALDDTRYAIDHFEQKLFKLPDMFQTDAGKSEAITRTKIMRDLLSCLRDELWLTSN